MLPVYSRPALNFLTEQCDGAGNLDESLIRYFVSYFNKAFPGPFPRDFVEEFEKFVNNPRVVQALGKAGAGAVKVSRPNLVVKEGI